MTSSSHTETAEKKGIDLGLRVQHPLLPNVTLPVYSVNYVHSDYGKGAIFACPAHDQRDFEFAQSKGLPKPQVICHEESDHCFEDAAYLGSGTMINSGPLDGLTVEDARKKGG